MSEGIPIGRVLFVRKGAYNSEVTYQKLDTIRYQGRDFVAIQETIGNTPPSNNESNEYWQLLSGAGSYQPSLNNDGILN